MTEAAPGTDRRYKLLLSAAIGTLLGGVLLWLVFRKADGAALLGALRGSDPMLVMLALGAALAAVVTKAVRWAMLLRNVVTLPVRSSLAAVFVGSAGNALLSHLGEVPRIMMAARASGAGTASLLASIVAERVFDLVAIAVLLAVLLIGADAGSGESTRVEWLLGGMGLFALVMVLAVLHLGGAIAHRLEGRGQITLSRWRVAAASRLRQVLQALEVFRNGSRLTRVFLASLVMWALFATCILCCLLATGTNASVQDALVVLGVNAAALILPAPPGRVGVIEASFAVALAGTLMSDAQVLAAAVIYNALMTIPFWCIGGLVWWRHSRRRVE